MRISAPSMYAAFGDKKRLFLEAMRLYAGDPVDLERMIADAPTAHDAARKLMTAAATTYTGEATPKGCLLASATASGSAAAADVQDAVADVRRTIEGRLRTRIERDIEKGMLPSGTPAAALAGLVLSVTQGMSVLARDGAPRTSPSGHCPGRASGLAAHGHLEATGRGPDRARLGLVWRKLRCGTRRTRCLIPGFDGAVFSREWKEALWARAQSEHSVKRPLIKLYSPCLAQCPAGLARQTSVAVADLLGPVRTTTAGCTDTRVPGLSNGQGWLNGSRDKLALLRCHVSQFRHWTFCSTKQGAEGKQAPRIPMQQQQTRRARQSQPHQGWMA